MDAAHYLLERNWWSISGLTTTAHASA